MPPVESPARKSPPPAKANAAALPERVHAATRARRSRLTDQSRDRAGGRLTHLMPLPPIGGCPAVKDLRRRPASAPTRPARPVSNRTALEGSGAGSIGGGPDATRGPPAGGSISNPTVHPRPTSPRLRPTAGRSGVPDGGWDARDVGADGRNGAGPGTRRPAPITAAAMLRQTTWTQACERTARCAPWVKCWCTTWPKACTAWVATAA